MWTTLFSVAFAAAICLSVAAILLQDNDRIGYQ
jgi:hypothetical protein